jgi:DNA-directed RNA polymerase delta subunit
MFASVRPPILTSDSGADAPEEMVMDYLKRAAKYAEDRGDEHWFSDVYTRLREHFNVHDSVWKALAFLYTDEVADQVEAG